MFSQRIFVLNPGQGKRLIAKGIMKEPQFEYALENGKISA